jgi:hypothetical protein
MCHTPTLLTQEAIDAGGSWRCVRCAQHWDAGRLATVAAYAEWKIDHDRGGRPGTEINHDAAPHQDAPTRSLGGTP